MSSRLHVRYAAKDDVYRDIARVPEPHRKDPRGNTIPEGEVCRLSVGEKSALVLLRGQGDTTEAAIWLDERTRNRLALTPDQDAEVEIQPVGLYGQLCWAWEASDPAYRVVARLAVLSVVLGAVGLVLGMASIFLSFAHL